MRSKFLNVLCVVAALIIFPFFIKTIVSGFIRYTRHADSNSKISQRINTCTEDTGDFLIDNNILIQYNGHDRHVIIPDNIEEIAEYAFCSNDDIEAVDIPGSAKEIGDNIFWGCSGLRYINIGEGVQKIGKSMCCSCPSLEDVNLPESLSDIGDYSFLNCSILNIHAPEGSYAQEYALKNDISSDCEYAEYFENNDKIIKAAQYEYGDFSEFEIEDDVTQIGAKAFMYCDKLEKIDIPSSVKRICGDAFKICYALKSVNINDGCTEICDGAFEYCETLTDVNIPASVTQIALTSFLYCSEDLVIHTPEGSCAEFYAMNAGIAYDNVMD